MHSFLKILTPIFLAGSLASSGTYKDVSLEAAEPYRPDIWNGELSNETLEDIYKSHRNDIEKIINYEMKRANLDVRKVFSRGAQTPYDKALYSIHWVKNVTLGQTSMGAAQIMSSHVGVSTNKLEYFIKDIKKYSSLLRFQSHSNCYAYAVNDADMSTSDGNPGDRTLPPSQGINTSSLARQFNKYTRQVISGAVSDGLIFTGLDASERKGYYRIALYIRQAARQPQKGSELYESNEYHFARQNRDGTWSHKYGPNNVMNIDYSGRIITDAKTADMRNYKFTGYFLAPEGGIDVGSPLEPVSKPGSKPGYREFVLVEDIVVTAPRQK